MTGNSTCNERMGILSYCDMSETTMGRCQCLAPNGMTIGTPGLQVPVPTFDPNNRTLLNAYMLFSLWLNICFFSIHVSGVVGERSYDAETGLCSPCVFGEYIDNKCVHILEKNCTK